MISFKNRLELVQYVKDHLTLKIDAHEQTRYGVYIEVEAKLDDDLIATQSRYGDVE